VFSHTLNAMLMVAVIKKSLLTSPAPLRKLWRIN
jgi:hypothetical protein